MLMNLIPIMRKDCYVVCLCAILLLTMPVCPDIKNKHL